MVRRTVFQHFDLQHYYTIFFVPMAGWKPYAISIFLEIIKNVWVFTTICFEEIVLKIPFFFSTLLCKCLLLIQKILNVSWKFWNIFWISFKFWGLKFYGVETHISKVANKATNVLQTNLWLVLRSHPKI